MRRILLAVSMVLLSASFAAADFYRYVDRDGREFFTNATENIPNEYRKNAVLVKTDDGKVQVSEENNARAKRPSVARDHKDKYGRGEAYWHKRADKLRKQLRALEDKYEVLLAQEKEGEGKPRKVSTRKGKTFTKAQLEKKIAQKKRELEIDLPEEARRADAYPGWLRE